MSVTLAVGSLFSTTVKLSVLPVSATEAVVFESVKPALSLSVVVELEWVLRSLYSFDKTTLIRTFNQLLGTRELVFQDEDVVEVAMSLYTENNTDFADCLHIATAHVYDYAPMNTFDRKAARVSGAQLLA